VDIPNSLFDPAKGNEVYNTSMDQLEFAESVGFDGIGCDEHHQNGCGLMPSSNMIAVGLAGRPRLLPYEQPAEAAAITALLTSEGAPCRGWPRPTSPTS
jgi:hypothetical protein